MDLDLNGRLDPSRLRLFDRQIERRSLADQRIQALAQFARRRLGVTGTHLAGVEQLAVILPADVERRDFARARPKLLHEGDDRKGLALLALELDPALLPARAVRLAQPLGDQAFQPQLAPLVEDHVAVGRKRLDIDEGFWRVLQKALQQALAILIRDGTQVIAAEVQEIERVVAHTLAALGAELPPELLEVRQAATAVHHGLAVDDRTVCLDQVGARGDRGELFGPVQACA